MIRWGGEWRSSRLLFRKTKRLWNPNPWIGLPFNDFISWRLQTSEVTHDEEGFRLETWDLRLEKREKDKGVKKNGCGGGSLLH